MPWLNRYIPRPVVPDKDSKAHRHIGGFTDSTNSRRRLTTYIAVGRDLFERVARLTAVVMSFGSCRAMWLIVAWLPPHKTLYIDSSAYRCVLTRRGRLREELCYNNWR